MRRREPFCFVAFDLLAVNGRDMHKLSLIDWKQILREIVPEESRSILFAKHVPRHRRDLFAAVCERDLEGSCATAGRAECPSSARGVAAASRSFAAHAPNLGPRTDPPQARPP